MSITCSTEQGDYCSVDGLALIRNLRKLRSSGWVLADWYRYVNVSAIPPTIFMVSLGESWRAADVMVLATGYAAALLFPPSTPSPQ